MSLPLLTRRAPCPDLRCSQSGMHVGWSRLLAHTLACSLSSNCAGVSTGRQTTICLSTHLQHAAAQQPLPFAVRDAVPPRLFRTTCRSRRWPTDSTCRRSQRPPCAPCTARAACEPQIVTALALNGPFTLPRRRDSMVIDHQSFAAHFVSQCPSAARCGQAHCSRPHAASLRQSQPCPDCQRPCSAALMRVPACSLSVCAATVVPCRSSSQRPRQLSAVQAESNGNGIKGAIAVASNLRLVRSCPSGTFQVTYFLGRLTVRRD